MAEQFNHIAVSALMPPIRLSLGAVALFHSMMEFSDFHWAEQHVVVLTRLIQLHVLSKNCEPAVWRQSKVIPVAKRVGNQIRSL